jgi:hypothetical protein
VKRYVLGVAALVALAVMTASPAWAAVVYFDDNFDQYADDADLTARGGWTVLDTENMVEVGGAWTVTNPGQRVNPPRFDGQPTTGGFLISDSDFASGINATGAGASHDLYSPAFSTVGGASVWLHMNASAQLNNNGTTIFDLDVSTDEGENWTNAFRRISPGRGSPSNPAPAPLPDNSNADGFYGRLDVDLSSLAANSEDVRVRVRHFEPTDDWWIAIDDFKVDDAAPLAPSRDVRFSADFSGGLGQMVVGGIQSGDLTWNCNDPGGRYVPGTVGQQNVNRLEHPGADPNFAIIDTDYENHAVDDYLMTPVLDLTDAYGIVLSYKSEGSVPYEGAMRVVLMRDGDGNGPDVDDEVVKVVFDYTAALHDPNEEPFYADRALSVAEAAGRDDVFFAWHFQGDNDWWWAVDDIKVTATLCPGDANGDGKVDDTDASILGAHWQTSGAAWEDGDFNADTLVNDADAVILAAHWHYGVNGEEGSVPEPSALVLLLGAAAMAWLGRRR